MPSVTLRIATLSLVTCLVGCSHPEAEPRPKPTTATGPSEPARAAPDEAKAPAAPSSSPSSTGSYSPLVLARGLRMVHAPAGDDAARIVREARTREAADGRDLVVYVGARWCEPCQRFHRAAESGALDAEFPRLSVLEFDLDEDRERLQGAGYSSQFIPLFVMPGDDGRGTSKRFEGAVKGERAVGNIAPRLRAILSGDDVR